ncbi:chloride channel protein [Acidiferrimicrobium sp. IK]|uniref:chloride channel protein n=1 Tax=Acidiferrimicrobium sp. IK TaxID=2871700 RepID=UPI0021CB62C4|nr:chloride channel protein [Acidiferrimicrobium sp. IK]MCU4183349.1 chloride channel protein [Acidiferrimicrobium sp. IK]
MTLMGVLHLVQHAAFDYQSGGFSAAVAARSDLRRVAVLVASGVFAGLGWWVLRRRAGGTGGEPTSSVWSGQGDLWLGPTVTSGVLSEVVIGMGASLGREAAPQHAGAAWASWLSRRLSLSPDQKVVLVACGAGAGVGAVYNVPLAGGVFAAELYLGSLTLTAVVPALIASAIATAVAWITLPAGPLYQVPALPTPSASTLGFALSAGLLIGGMSAGFVRLIGWASDHRPEGWKLLVGPVLALGVLGLLSVEYPLLLGNGRDLAQFAFDGRGAVLTLVALAALKPVVTSMCLRGGASGGLFTPTVSFGAVVGALLGHAWALAWPGSSPATYAVIGAAAMLGAAMQAPVSALVFTVELTGTAGAQMVALALAVAVAVVVSRSLERRSIYSARLSAGADAEAGPTTERRPGD